MKKKIYITRKIPEVGIKMLKKNGFDIDIYKEEKPPAYSKIVSVLKNKKYDGVVCLLTDKIDKKIFEISPQTKIFANYAVGYNNIDIVEAKNRNIVVTNAPGSLDGAVAEHALALLLSLTTRTVEGDKYLRSGKWTGWGPMQLLGESLFGKTIGIVGAGHIGYGFAELLYKAFNSKILYFSSKKNEKFEMNFKGEQCTTLEDLLKKSDVVSIHVPLGPTTHHLINAKNIKLMKKNAVIINTSRGAVIDEKALVNALKNKKIAGAGLDVFEFEPKITPGLTKLSNVVLTPHIGSAEKNARDEMSVIAAQNIIDFFAGKTPNNKVN